MIKLVRQNKTKVNLIEMYLREEANLKENLNKDQKRELWSIHIINDFYSNCHILNKRISPNF